MFRINPYKLKIGDQAPDFSLPSTDGNTHTLSDFNTKLLCVFFTCNHCPYALAYEGRVMELADEFAEECAFVGINSNDEKTYPEDSFERMKKRENKEEFNFTYLRDETQEVAHAYGARCTPHFIVFDSERKLRYQGRLDNDWENPRGVTKHELQDAIIALLKNEEPYHKVTHAFGCSIKWKDNRQPH
ncbi:thioredoxin family protein [Candidatus Woesearchaeota archaeon]|nr:thioredoxin family protein [Candidatus Woesearchaeota archaeon]